MDEGKNCLVSGEQALDTNDRSWIFQLNVYIWTEPIHVCPKRFRARPRTTCCSTSSTISIWKKLRIPWAGTGILTKSRL